MATACIAQSTLQVYGISKPIIARFDQPRASSDGGAGLSKSIDDHLGLTWHLAAGRHRPRQTGYPRVDECQRAQDPSSSRSP